MAVEPSMPRFPAFLTPCSPGRTPETTPTNAPGASWHGLNYPGCIHPSSPHVGPFPYNGRPSKPPIAVGPAQIANISSV